MEKEPTPERDFSIQAMRVLSEYGEDAEPIVRMISAYVDKGWMDYEQAMLMLKDIFYKEAND